MTKHQTQAGGENFEAYAEYAKNLRIWFVSFGIGAPLALVSGTRLSDALSASGNLYKVVLLYLIGVALQIILSLLNKYTNWICYYGENHKEFQGKRVYKIALAVSRRFELDGFIDLSTFALFFCASVAVLRSLAE